MELLCSNKTPNQSGKVCRDDLAKLLSFAALENLSIPSYRATTPKPYSRDQAGNTRINQARWAATSRKGAGRFQLSLIGVKSARGPSVARASDFPIVVNPAFLCSALTFQR